MTGELLRLLHRRVSTNAHVTPQDGLLHPPAGRGWRARILPTIALETVVGGIIERHTECYTGGDLAWHHSMPVSAQPGGGSMQGHAPARSAVARLFIEAFVTGDEPIPSN